MGLRLSDLGTRRLPWHDLWVIVKQSPLSSALNRVRRGDAAQYAVTDYLLALQINVLRDMSWQLGGDPDAARPEPFYLPGFDNPDKPEKLGDAMSIEEMDARLAPYQPR